MPCDAPCPRAPPLSPPPCAPQVRCKLMSVTQTLSGINIKQLLLGTVTDQVRGARVGAGLG